LRWWARLGRGDRLACRAAQRSASDQLAIVNAPHPLIFQKSLIEDSDQRAASQYINWFRTPGAEKAIEAMGLDVFFQKDVSGHADLSKMPEAEKQQYLADWSQPVRCFRCSIGIGQQTDGAAAGCDRARPDWLLRAFPKIHVPTLSSGE
jgi:hypothetical protein